MPCQANGKIHFREMILWLGNDRNHLFGVKDEASSPYSLNSRGWFGRDNGRSERLCIIKVREHRGVDGKSGGNDTQTEALWWRSGMWRRTNIQYGRPWGGNDPEVLVLGSLWSSDRTLYNHQPSVKVCLQYATALVWVVLRRFSRQRKVHQLGSGQKEEGGHRRGDVSCWEITRTSNLSQRWPWKTPGSQPKTFPFMGWGLSQISSQIEKQWDPRGLPRQNIFASVFMKFR